MKKVSLITDGSCLGNPGPGGWACILRFGAATKELFGYDPQTTNNRMELMAPIQGLLALKKPCAVEVTTDSEYVRQGITQWIIRWKRRHWWKKNRPVRNADLWMELDELVLLCYKLTISCRIVLWAKRLRQAHKNYALRHISRAWRKPQGMPIVTFR